jgi:hypothetical protein
MVSASKIPKTTRKTCETPASIACSWQVPPRRELLDRQVGGFCAVDDLVHIERRAPVPGGATQDRTLHRKAQVGTPVRVTLARQQPPRRNLAANTFLCARCTSTISDRITGRPALEPTSDPALFERITDATPRLWHVARVSRVSFRADVAMSCVNRRQGGMAWRPIARNAALGMSVYMNDTRGSPTVKWLCWRDNLRAVLCASTRHHKERR